MGFQVFLFRQLIACRVYKHCAWIRRILWEAERWIHSRLRSLRDGHRSGSMWLHTQPDTCARGHGFYNPEYRSVDIDKLSYRERISSNTIYKYHAIWSRQNLEHYHLFLYQIKPKFPIQAIEKEDDGVVHATIKHPSMKVADALCSFSCYTTLHQSLMGFACLISNNEFLRPPFFFY